MLPGDYRVNDPVEITVNEVLANGIQLSVGRLGRVMGPSHPGSQRGELSVFLYNRVHTVAGHYYDEARRVTLWCNQVRPVPAENTA